MTDGEIIEACKQIGAVVYLITDEYQVKRLVVDVIISQGEIKYGLMCGAEHSIHHGFEISTHKVTV